MEEITVVNENLPSNIDDLSKFVLIGREKLVAMRAEIKAIDKVGLAKDVREQRLHEAQDVADVVLDAEVKIGELMAAVPKATKGNQYTGKMVCDTAVTNQTKVESLRDAGFSGSDEKIRQMAHRFETLAAHPDIVAQAKAEARENEDIVSRSLVLNKIKAEQKEQHRQEREQAIAEKIEKPSSSQFVDIYTTDKKYRVIYADPPWSYGDKQNIDGLGGAVKHYPTMPLKDICELPVPAADNAVLFLWVTAPMLEDAFKIVNAWGFEYKTNFVWDKVAHNMGHYSSVRHELLFLCTRGSCLPDVPKLYDSVVSIERTEHSKKPKEFRDMIDTLYPLGERLEMFAREAPEGWDVWGNMA